MRGKQPDFPGVGILQLWCLLRYSLAIELLTSGQILEPLRAPGKFIWVKEVLKGTLLWPFIIACLQQAPWNVIMFHSPSQMNSLDTEDHMG